MNHINSFNQVILIGRLGKDPVLKESKGKNATSFVNLSIATYKRFKSGKKTTNWSQVTYWGDSATAWAMEWLKKGMLVQINGELSSRRYTDRQGVERTATDVRAYEIIMLAAVRIKDPEEERQEEYEQEVNQEQTSQDKQVPQEEDDSDFY